MTLGCSLSLSLTLTRSYRPSDVGRKVSGYAPSQGSCRAVGPFFFSFQNNNNIERKSGKNYHRAVGARATIQHRPRANLFCSNCLSRCDGGYPLITAPRTHGERELNRGRTSPGIKIIQQRSSAGSRWILLYNKTTCTVMRKVNLEKKWRITTTTSLLLQNIKKRKRKRQLQWNGVQCSAHNIILKASLTIDVHTHCVSLPFVLLLCHIETCVGPSEAVAT